MIIDPNLKGRNQRNLSQALTLFNQTQSEYFLGFAVDGDKKVITSATDKFTPKVLAETMRNFANTIAPVVSDSDMVREFMLLFDQEFRTTPSLPTAEEMDFRTHFLGEELDELRVAYELKRDIPNPDLSDFADAICDIFYVLHGLVLQAGMAQILPAMMQEVHRSNISKICNSQEEAEKTCEYVLETMGESCYIRTKEVQLFAGRPPKTVWMVYRERDGKVMKSINWKAPDLKSILENATTKTVS